MGHDTASERVVLDANVLIAVIRPDIGRVRPDESDASIRLLDLVDRRELRAFLCAPILAEVIHILARNGVPSHTRAGLIARWQSMPERMEIVPLDGTLASEAGEYRQQYYHREQLPLSYVDCFCVALANRLDAPLITLEEPLLRAPGVRALSPSRFVAS